MSESVSASVRPGPESIPISRTLSRWSSAAAAAETERTVEPAKIWANIAWAAVPAFQARSVGHDGDGEERPRGRSRRGVPVGPDSARRRTRGTRRSARQPRTTRFRTSSAPSTEGAISFAISIVG